MVTPFWGGVQDDVEDGEGAERGWRGRCARGRTSVERAIGNGFFFPPRARSSSRPQSACPPPRSPSPTTCSPRTCVAAPEPPRLVRGARDVRGAARAHAACAPALATRTPRAVLRDGLLDRRARGRATPRATRRRRGARRRVGRPSTRRRDGWTSATFRGSKWAASVGLITSPVANVDFDARRALDKPRVDAPITGRSPASSRRRVGRVPRAQLRRCRAPPCRVGCAGDAAVTPRHHRATRPTRRVSQRRGGGVEGSMCTRAGFEVASR